MHIEQGGTFPAITPWLRLPTRNGDLDWRNSLGWVDTAGHPLKSRWCPKRKRPRSRVRSVVDDRDQRRRRPRQRSVTHMPEAGADSLLVYGFTAMTAHLLMSLGQTLFHRYLGHSRLGGRFFRNHIQFHHVHYAGDGVDPIKPDTQRVGKGCTPGVSDSPAESGDARCCSPPSSYR